MFIDKSITTQKDWPTNNDQLINNDISGILQRTHYLHFSMNIIVLECTVGDDGSVADISCMSIFSHVQGLTQVLTKYKSQGVNVLMFHLIK